jgi:hypothetical protein
MAQVHKSAQTRAWSASALGLAELCIPAWGQSLVWLVLDMPCFAFPAGAFQLDRGSLCLCIATVDNYSKGRGELSLLGPSVQIDLIHVFHLSPGRQGPKVRLSFALTWLLQQEGKWLPTLPWAVARGPGCLEKPFSINDKSGNCPCSCSHDGHTRFCRTAWHLWFLYAKFCARCPEHIV